MNKNVTAIIIVLIEVLSVQFTIAQQSLKHYKFTPPSFGNGDKALINYFHERVTLRSKDAKNEITGKLVIKFKLSKEGEMEQFVVLDSTSSQRLNKEVMDYLRMSKNNWHKATIAGQDCDINILFILELPTLAGYRGDYVLVIDNQYIVDKLFFNNYYNIGADLAMKQQYQEAIPYFDEVISNTNNDIDALYNRGICYLKTGDTAKACDDWEVIKNSGSYDADRLLLKYCNK